MSEQLTLDGRMPPPAGTSPRQAPLSAAQREILRTARDAGGIRPRDAGIIVHAHRPARCPYCTADDPRGPCPWVSSDGVDALKRLAKRGLLQHATRGWWTPL